jgi:putative membrane protein
MSRVMPITVALAAMLAAPNAVAQVTSSPDATASPWPTVGRDSGFGGTAADTAYIRQTILSNFSEVGLGRLAESRAADSAVKEFAERMISEHNSMNEQWADLARKNDMKVTLEFSSAGRQSGERLQGLSGAAFDQAYMAEMIRLHEQDLAAFQRMAASAGSPEVRQLASSGVPTIRGHLALAQQVGSRVGVSTTAGRTGGVTNPVPTPSDEARRRSGDETNPVPTPSDDARRRTGDDRATGDARDDRNDRDDRPPLGAGDRTFVEGVLSDHLMHIRLAKRAQREVKSEEARRLAEGIEKDFTKWAERWEKFADRRDANVTSHLERQHREKLERLDKATERKNFDRAYAAIVAEHLEAVLRDFREEGREERSAPVVRRLAEGELPVIREYVARARRLEKQTDERKDASDRE